MKRAFKRARKLGIQKKFEQWCEDNKRQLTADSFVAFDAVNGKLFLDHEKAKKDGYYHHLRMQAATIISSWATVEVLKPNAGGAPFPSCTAVPLTRKVSVQDIYVLPGKGAVRVSRMDDGDRIQLANIFKIEAENKLTRAYIIAKQKGKLPETRQLMRQAFNEAEEAAYSSVA